MLHELPVAALGLGGPGGWPRQAVMRLLGFPSSGMGSHWSFEHRDGLI